MDQAKIFTIGYGRGDLSEMVPGLAFKKVKAPCMTEDPQIN